RAAAEPSTAVTCRPRAASSRACLPVPQARSNAGPRGSNGSISVTKLAGSGLGLLSAARCLSSHSAKEPDIKKAPGQKPRSLGNPSRREYHSQPQILDAERTPATAG